MSNLTKFTKNFAKDLLEFFDSDGTVDDENGIALQKLISDTLSEHEKLLRGEVDSEEGAALEKGEDESDHTEASSEEVPKKVKGKAAKAPAKGKKAPAKTKAPAKGKKVPAKKAPKAKKVEEDASGSSVEETNDLSKMKIPELKALAKERKVNIKGKTKKDDIVAALLKAAAGVEDEKSEEVSEKSEADDEQDFDSLTLAELKTRIDGLNECREKADKISKVGKKDELVKRLKKASE